MKSPEMRFKEEGEAARELRDAFISYIIHEHGGLNEASLNNEGASPTFHLHARPRFLFLDLAMGERTKIVYLHFAFIARKGTLTAATLRLRLLLLLNGQKLLLLVRILGLEVRNEVL